jgi:hypothetical protein
VSSVRVIGLGATKPLRRAPLWLVLWWVGIGGVIVSSLLPAGDLPPVFPGGDKLEHGLGYGLLAAFAVQLFVPRAALRAGVGLVLLGIALELAQGAFTTTRSMDPWDALADACGVGLGLAVLATPMRDLLLRHDR